MTLSTYERRALQEVNERKAAQVARSPRRLVPGTVGDRARQAADYAGRVPGAKQAVQAYTHALTGLARATSKGANVTLSEERVIRAYQKRGFAIAALEDIRSMELHEIEKSVRPKRMDLVYASIAAVEGAAAGAVVTGAELLATVGSVASAGAASAPGAGAVGTAMAGDAAFVLAAAQRVVSHTVLYYGYDPFDPAERVFAMSVVNLGSALTAGGKVAGYSELSRVTQLLARRATWKQLNEHALPMIAQRFAVRFGMRLTQRKLGQLVPVVGIALGAGMNYRLVDEVADTAHWTYRERFLLEKDGNRAQAVVPTEPDDDPGEGEPEVAIDLLEILASQNATDGDEVVGTG